MLRVSQLVFLLFSPLLFSVIPKRREGPGELVSVCCEVDFLLPVRLERRSVDRADPREVVEREPGQTEQVRGGGARSW